MEHMRIQKTHPKLTEHYSTEDDECCMHAPTHTLTHAHRHAHRHARAITVCGKHVLSTHLTWFHPIDTTTQHT